LLLIKCSIYDFYNTYTSGYSRVDVAVCWGGKCWTVVDVRLHDDCQYSFHTMQKYINTQSLTPIDFTQFILMSLANLHHTLVCALSVSVQLPLAVFHNGNPFFQMEIPLFIYASLIMPSFSVLGKTQTACIMVILLSTVLNPASLISTWMFDSCNVSTSINNSVQLEKSKLCTVLK
jgi:hypothetical protein